MDEKMDPCDDFYAFACGNSNSSGLIQLLKKSFNRRLSIILNDQSKDDYDTPVDKQVKLFYQSCKRIQIGYNYEESLRHLISEFGTMPVLEGDAWQELQFNWQETSARISYRYGVMPILAVVITNDVAENHINRAYLGHPDFHLVTRSMYSDENNAIHRSVYRNKIQRILEKFLSVKSTLARQTAQELLDFEVELTRKLPETVDDFNPDKSTVSGIHERYSHSIDIERFFYTSLGENITDAVYEHFSQYQKNLIEVLKRTPAKTLANYIFYQLVSYFVEYPSETEEEQKEACLDITKKHFAKYLDNMAFRRNSNRNEISKEIELLWHQLKNTFNYTLSSSSVLDWMEPENRGEAIKKLASLTLHINSYDENELAREYAGLELQGVDYVKDLQKIRLLEMVQIRAALHKPAKSQDIYPGETPFNIIVTNTISIPVALLEPYPFWSEAFPKSILYGTLASLIGHEIMHTFYGLGSSYDHNAELCEHEECWDIKTIENFEKLEGCFNKQYENFVYRYNNFSPNGKKNIADNGGVRLAYAAYRSWYRVGAQTLKDKEKLPDLDYTANQLFFISYAQNWCNTGEGPENPIKNVADKFRAIGPLSNFEEFATEFQCSINSNMNPRNKCKIF
ncbi:neprilysin-21-like [Drosophila tropicalis]|uniref:neprilysin-21-like n=1 Tax=Drosophila tropicalis TaxID=46794 RepID=UPI0035ABCB72